MSYLIIILGIIVVLLIYYIYVIINAAPTVATNLYLKNNPSPIAASKITNPTTTTYTVGVWIYINNFSSNIGTFLIFGNNTNNLGTNGGPLFALRMDPTSPILYVDIAGSNRGLPPTKSSSNSIAMTNNFPLQTWTYVTASVSNYYADLYLNGKLVISSKLEYPSAASAGTDSPYFSFGSNSPDMYITGLSRWPQPLDPQSVWSYYSQGNGNSSGMFGSTYRMNILLKRDSNSYDYPVF